MLSTHSGNQRRLVTHQAVDRISSLPDTVLHHILSFVPTKSAVKISVLSKRWKGLWTKVPSLDFTEMPYSRVRANLTIVQRIYFMNFVDKVLLSNDASYVRQLRIHLFKGLFLEDHDVYVKSWLSAIRRCHIHEIILTSQLEPVFLPTEFLSNETLAVLKLDGPFAFDVPVCLHLPNLEIIHLNSVHLPNDELVKSLSLGCPVLKELLIENCRGISMLCVESSTLKILKVRSTLNRLHSSYSFIAINAPNLGFLCLEDLVNQLDICDLISLKEAKLNLYDDKNALQVLSKISTIETLQLRAYDARSVSSGASRVVSAALNFENLTCLKLDACCRILCMFLKYAPKLKSLVIEEVTNWDYSFESKFAPKHLPCLQSVELRKFEGGPEEMEFVEYILKAGLVLKKMQIFFYYSLAECEIDVYQDLLVLPRSSGICRVEVVREC